MARPEAETALGRDRDAVGELAVLEREEFQRAGIFRLVLVLVVAAAHQDRGVVVRRGANLVGENSAIERCRLLDLLAEAAVGADPVHRDAARIVVGSQRKGARRIDAAVDRTGAQRDRRTMRLQFAARSVDAERAEEMAVALDARGARAAIAGGDIEERRLGMRPGILDVFGQLRRAALDQPGVIRIGQVEPQGRAEADIEEGCFIALSLS